MIEDCPYTCSDGECPGPAGNDLCQDEEMYCLREKFLVFFKHPLICFKAPDLKIFFKGNCDITSDDYYPTIKDCHFTCTDGQCNGKEGNDRCEDTWWACPKYVAEVNFLIRISLN